MRPFISFCLCLLVSLTPGATALAQGDAARGAALVAQHCARCHDVSEGGANKQFPPSFASIAVFRAPEQIHARIVMPPIHSGMPEVALYLLDTREVEDIVAYIVSLDK